MIRFKGHSEGKIIVPDEPVDIPDGQEFHVCLEKIDTKKEKSESGQKAKVNALARILEMAVDLGPPDLSENYRRYFGKEASGD